MILITLKREHAFLLSTLVHMSPSGQQSELQPDNK